MKKWGYILLLILSSNCIAWSQFKHYVNFQDSIYEGYLSYKNDTIIFNKIDSFHVTIKNNISLENCKLIYPSFDYIRFKKDVRFILDKFNYAIFIRSSFSNNVCFQESIFDDDAVFFDIFFLKDADFQKAVFKGNVIFAYSTFSNSAYFYQTHFNNLVDFSSTKFYHSAVFIDLALSDSAKIIFKNTTLPDTIYFSSCHSHNDIDLSVADFNDDSRYDSLSDSYRKGRWHYINLYKSDISKFCLDYTHFRLLLTNPTTSKELPIDEAKSVYEALLENFKDRGQMESYELLDIEYHDYQWSKKSPWISWLYIFPKYWNNYGYAKGWVFGWTIFFLIAFTVITYRWFNTLIDSVYSLDNIPHQMTLSGINTSPNRWGLIGTRLWYSFIYTSAIFFLFSLKVDKIKFKKRWYLIYIMLVYAAGLICLAYMASFVLQK